MKRQALLKLLSAYHITAKQQPILSDFISFVSTNADCFERTCAPGHITGSAWILNYDFSKVLLCHHRKLDKWIQLGGHADGDADILNVAWKEGCEESGLNSIKPMSEDIFDIDIHQIPVFEAVPAHLHYDVRFIFQADEQEKLLVSPESNQLAWVDLKQISEYSQSESILRLASKTKRLY